MKHLMIITFDSTSSEHLKSDVGLFYRAIADARAKTNGTEIWVHEENRPENTEVIHMVTTRLIKWSGYPGPPSHDADRKKRRKVARERRKGWLGQTISNMKNEVMAGLTT